MSAAAARKSGGRPLNREMIVDAALRLIDEHGLESQSMRQLGAELGVDPMAVYYHVPNKAALYDLIVDRVVSEVSIADAAPGADSEELLVSAGTSWLAALMRHPRALPLLSARSLRTPDALRPIEVLLGVLFDYGLEPARALAAVDTLAWFILGSANAYAGGRLESEYAADTSIDRLRDLPAAEFPNMTRLLETGEYLGFEGEFQVGLRAMVRGLLGKV